MFIAGCKFTGLVLARFYSGLEGIKDTDFITSFVKVGYEWGREIFQILPVHTWLRERLQCQVICHWTADIKISENLCKWPAVENALHSGQATDHQAQVVENQTQFLFLWKKIFLFLFLFASFSECKCWYLWSLTYELSWELQPRLTTFGNVWYCFLSFVSYFVFTTLFFLFLRQIQWTLVVAIYCWEKNL